MANSKTKAIQVRLTKKDRERIDEVAKAHYLDTSSWARMTMLRAVDMWEAENEG